MCRLLPTAALSLNVQYCCQIMTNGLLLLSPLQPPVSLWTRVYYISFKSTACIFAVFFFCDSDQSPQLRMKTGGSCSQQQRGGCGGWGWGVESGRGYTGSR